MTDRNIPVGSEAPFKMFFMDQSLQAGLSIANIGASALHPCRRIFHQMVFIIRRKP
jgi:hypothetical protein